MKTKKPKIREDVFGWFDDPSQTKPAHDPGEAGLCPVCGWPVGKHSIDNPLKTISIAAFKLEFRDRSFFFRAHKNCWNRTSPHERMMIESSIINESIQSY